MRTKLYTSPYEAALRVQTISLRARLAAMEQMQHLFDDVESRAEYNLLSAQIDALEEEHQRYLMEQRDE